MTHRGGGPAPHLRESLTITGNADQLAATPSLKGLGRLASTADSFGQQEVVQRHAVGPRKG